MEPMLSNNFLLFKSTYDNNTYECKTQDKQYSKQVTELITLVEKAEKLSRAHHCKHCITCLCKIGCFSIQNVITGQSDSLWHAVQKHGEKPLYWPLFQVRFLHTPLNFDEQKCQKSQQFQLDDVWNLTDFNNKRTLSRKYEMLKALTKTWKYNFHNPHHVVVWQERKKEYRLVSRIEFN